MKLQFYPSWSERYIIRRIIPVRLTDTIINRVLFPVPRCCFFLNPRLSICPLVSRVTDLAVALGFPRTNVLQVCINRSQRPSKTFSLCVHVSRLPLRLGDVLVDDVAGETLLFFLLPHEQDTLMNEDVLFLRKRKRKHFFYSCDYEASRTP